MIQQSVECKRIGNEYVDLFRKLLQYIHYTNFSKDFITDDDLKMLSELEFYISSGKYEIIEFGTRKSPFDVREKLEELEEKNKTFEDYNKDLNNQLDKLEKENKSLKTNIKTLKRRRKKQTSKKNKYKDRINKAIEYIVTNREPVDEKDGEVLFWLSDGFDEEDLLKILKGEE